MRARTLLLVFVLAACGRSGLELPGDDDGGSYYPFPHIPVDAPTATPTPTGTGTPAGIVEWTHVIASADDDAAFAIDHAANRVGIAGSFRGTATFAPGVMSTAAGGDDGFVAVFTTGGTLAWRRAMGGAASDVARAIAMRDDGAVVTGGRFESATIDFGNGARSASGNGDLFTAAYQANGNPMWDVTDAVTSRDEVFAVEWGTWVLLMGDREDAGGDTDAFVYRQNEANGSNIGQIEHSQASADDRHRAVAFNAASDRYVGVGWFQGSGTYDSDGAPTFTSQNDDAFAWHCLVGANCITWSLRIGGIGDEHATAVASVPNGDWLIAGTHSDNATAGATTLANGGGVQIFVTRVSSTGAFLWAKTFGGSGDESVSGIGIDASGRIYVAGTYDGAFAAGGAIPNLPNRNPGTYLLVLESDGDALSSHAIGGDNVEAQALAVHPSGSLYLTGAFSGTTDLGRGPVTSAGSRDAFLLRAVVP